ncbi:unnamed protein product [Spirodela intermedia]|uniref:Uncharacterized protein n=1 Tax=Spirodela intermedia TaxID=51605 RepID=A0A7I8LGK6_SPIIN|nr:unnamed protein product [Spirodela intermedia]
MAISAYDAALIFIAASSPVAVYRAREEPLSSSAFAMAAYLNLLALFLSVKLLDTTPPADRTRRRRLKAAVLVLGTTLQATFSYRVCKLLPLSLSLFLWSAVVLVAGGGGWLLQSVDGGQ